MTERSMKWLIVEDALRDRWGHWSEYVSNFVRGLTALGDEVVVLCDRRAEGFILEQTGALPVLPESIWHRMSDGSGALKRYARVPVHAVATFLAMRKFFRSFDHRGHREHGGGDGEFSHSSTANTDMAAGPCLDKPSGAAFSNPSTSELARDSENTSLNRSAIGPASAAALESASLADAGHSRSECSGVFEEPSSSLLGSGAAKTPPARAPGVPASAFSSVLISEISGKKNSEPLDTGLSTLDSNPAVPDVIFVPTVLVHHLLGWWLLIKSGSVPKGSRVLLFFPNLPIGLDDSGWPFWTAGPTTKLMAWLFGQLQKEVESGRVILGVETHAMQRALEGLIGMRVVYLPHPVEFPAEARRRRVEDASECLTTENTVSTEDQIVQKQGGALASQAGAEFSNPSTSELARDCENTSLNRSAIDPASALDSKTSAKPIVFGCYGAARWEKGSDVLQAAIRLVLQKAETLKSEKLKEGFEVASERWRVASGENQFLPATSYPLLVTASGRPLHFKIQWVEDFRDGEGNLVSIDPWLREHQQVEVIGRYFEGDEYERRLGETDVMVLPYRSPYRLRVSRVVIEAMLSGIPVIATRGTTLLEQAQAYGVGVGCYEDDAQSLSEAILEVLVGFEKMRDIAIKKSNKASDSFSVATFRQKLSQV
jgi:glycosyltransferase involved in cell wall biosynthesis